MRAHEVNFASSGATLVGAWYTPPESARHPAVVLVHGAGAMDRSGPGGYLTETAAYFVSRGFAVLSYDKRGTGASSGDWRTMSFADLASDVAAAVRYVRSRDDVDAGSVGLWGISQAGWVLPLAAQSASPEFVIAVSAAGTGVTPAEQNMYDIGHQARAARLDEKQRDSVLSAWRALYALVRSDRGPDAEAGFRRARDAASTIPGAGPMLPPPAGGIRWTQRDQWFLALDLDYDAVSAWAALDIPVLAIYGSADVSTPTDRVVARFRQDVAREGSDASIAVIDGGSHVLTDDRVGSTRLLAEYTSVMDTWLTAQAYRLPRQPHAR
ncbi:MAG: alpha/beta fold hydrolase [Gemmatimonadota bacterium]|nr:alpha/beta fold hydrolase [Gemmatimonadota bacterium]